MIKILINVLAVLLVASGAVGAAAAGADEDTMESLQLWTRQLFQEQVELHTQDQTQARVGTGQPETDQDTPVQTRLMLENHEMLQTQNQIQSRQQIQLNQTIGLQNGTTNQWGMESSGSTARYGPDSNPNLQYQLQTKDGCGKQQGGRP